MLSFNYRQKRKLPIETSDNLEEEHRRNRIAFRKSLRNTPLSAKQSTTADDVKIKEIYSECIKLSAANKINTKNAFGLQLIDYMSDLIKDKPNEPINFKLASSALDAGTKIYGNRVDCVHAEAQKVASGLVMALDKEGKEVRNLGGDDGDLEEKEDGDDESRPKRKKNVKKTVKTIAPNVESINVTKVECNIPPDPLFAQLSSSFDIGNVNGLLMTNIIINNNHQLLLDSNELEIEKSSNTVSIQPFIDLFENILSTNAQLVPKLDKFEFLSRNEAVKLHSDIDQETSIPNPRAGSEAMSFVFDINADIHGSQSFEPSTDLGEFDDHYNSGDEDQNLFGDNNLNKTLLRAVDADGLAKLIGALSDQPTDYCYFNKDIIGAWAGPDYWRLNPSSKINLKKSDEVKAQRKSKNKFEEISFKNILVDRKPEKVNNKGTQLKLSTISKWTDRLLPQDHCYDPGRLVRPYLKSGITFGTGKDSQAGQDKNFHINGDTHSDGYDSPGLGDGLDVNDNFDDCIPTADEGFPTQAYSQDAGNSESAPFSADQLVDEPYLIFQTQIAFCSQAKKIDVKKLKKEMWSLITMEESQILESSTVSVKKIIINCLNLKNNDLSVFC